MGLDREADASDEPAAADGDEDRVHVGSLREQLEAERALPGDDALVVEGVDEGESALGLDLAGAPVRLIVVRAVQDDLGAVATRRRHLDEGGQLRLDVNARRPGRRGGEGEGEVRKATRLTSIHA